MPVEHRLFPSTVAVSITLYLITHNHPQDTKGQAVTWQVTASTARQMCRDGLSRGGKGRRSGRTSYPVHSETWQTADPLWTGLTRVLKGNKASVLLKCCFMEVYKGGVVTVSEHSDCLALKRISPKSNRVTICHFHGWHTVGVRALLQEKPFLLLHSWLTYQPTPL